MRIQFKADIALQKGLALLMQDLNFCLAENDADIVVEAMPCKENKVQVKFCHSFAMITYGGGISRFFRGFALLLEAISEGKTEYTVCETPRFLHNGAMYTANNAPVSVVALKQYMRKMALMGLDTLQIYTEDNFDIPGYPYAGYMRGKYTAEELKELDA